LAGPANDLAATHFVPYLSEKMQQAAQAGAKFESIEILKELV
jgi:hypothetical protein